MNKLTIVPNRQLVSETFRVDPKRADTIWAMMATKVYMFVEFKLTNGLDIAANDLLDYVSTDILEKIDQENKGELVYFGFKYSELLERTQRFNSIGDIYNRVKAVAEDGDSWDELVTKYLPLVKPF